MKKVLITGFDPFGNDKINPSYEAVKNLPDRINNIEIIKKEIPTVIDKSVEELIKLINIYKPDVVINVGQAGGRNNISIERVAINIGDFIIKDNEENQPIDKPINPNGPAAYFSTLPIKRIVKTINETNIKSSVSNTAGTFVCNTTMYSVLDYIKQNDLLIKSGFIHVPYIPEQVEKNNIPSMKLETITKGLELAIISCFKEEIKVSMGKIS